MEKAYHHLTTISYVISVHVVGIHGQDGHQRGASTENLTDRPRGTDRRARALRTTDGGRQVLWLRAQGHRVRSGGPRESR